MSRFTRHRGLRLLHERGDARFLPAAYAKRIRRALALLSDASGPGDLAGFGRLHPLHGDRAGLWAIRVSANWRIVFRFEDGRVRDVDLVDYH